MRRPIAAATAAVFLLAACQTTQAPPPAPEPVPEFTPAGAPPPPPPPAPAKQFVTVSGSSVNVRGGPSTDKPVLGRVGRGDRLETTGKSGDWYELVLADGRRGFVHSKYVRLAEPCPPDTAAPQILVPPPLSFNQGDRHGTVQLRLSIDAAGAVSAVKVASNDTGDAGLAEQAVTEVKAMKFAPLVRRCKPTPFVYVFNRTF
jgi:TonB family protein